MSEIATVPAPRPTGSATEVRKQEMTLFDPDLDFRKLVGEAAYHARGFRLVAKSELIGVPHAVISVTYREGYLDPATKIHGDYVSVEAVVADADTLHSAPIRHNLPAELTVFGNEPVVYNDGSTGIRRSLTELFQEIGLIDVGPARPDDENEFDRPFSLWARGADRAQEGITADLDGNKFRFICARGLRKSEYENEYGPGVTYYLG